MEFSMQLRQDLRLQQRQMLMPQQIQSMELLQLPMMELRARLDQELQENPALEMVEEAESSPDAPDGSDDRTDSEEQFDKLDSMDGEWDRYFQSTSRPKRSSGDESDVNQALANTAAPPETLQEYLIEQVRMMDLPSELRDLAEGIAYSIDDSGYLRYPLGDVVDSVENGHAMSQAREVLLLIQRIGPPGVGARNVTECLLLQLNGTVDSVLEKLLITYHLEDIQNNRLPKIAKDTGRTLEEVKEAIDRIAHLNPRPGDMISATHARYIIPDLAVRYVEGRYEVVLLDGYLPTIRVSPYYREMLKGAKGDPKVVKYVRNKIGAADWLVSSLEQRRDTLQRIGNEIVRVQKGFFDEGAAGLKPLRMQDVADVVGVHVSTVSRGIADKYVDTPRGVYRLKFFFTGGLDTTNGQTQTQRSVKEEIRALIDMEDKHVPISDGDIVKKLNEKGIEIARRTVAKYRSQLDIPSSSLRKQH